MTKQNAANANEADSLMKEAKGIEQIIPFEDDDVNGF